MCECILAGAGNQAPLHNAEVSPHSSHFPLGSERPFSPFHKEHSVALPAWGSLSEFQRKGGREAAKKKKKSLRLKKKGRARRTSNVAAHMQNNVKNQTAFVFLLHLPADQRSGKTWVAV